MCISAVRSFVRQARHLKVFDHENDIEKNTHKGEDGKAVQCFNDLNFTSRWIFEAGDILEKSGE